MKRIFIIHGWDGHPDEQWFPWLKEELEQRGFFVEVPQMPNPETPEISVWVSFLAQIVGVPDADTYFVGHSIGVQTILRYLESVDIEVGGVVAVAGFFALRPESLEGNEVRAIAHPWLTQPIDVERVKRNANKIIAIFSDNDKYVPLENKELFQDRLGARTLVLHRKGHLGASDQVPQVPEILEAVIFLTNSR